MGVDFYVETKKMCVKKYGHVKICLFNYKQVFVANKF